jgi:glycosyltransferase involved in cell wall biosynthesis
MTLASRVRRFAGRSERSLLIVNTVEHEAALRAAAMHERSRVVIRETPQYLKGVRGRLRKHFLQAMPDGTLAGVGRAQSDRWSDVLGTDVVHLMNVYELPDALPPRFETPVRFLTAGRRTSSKGTQLAVEAWGQMRHRDRARLLIAGGDFGSRETDGVSWLGHVPDLANSMRDIGDVYLAVSTEETFSRASVEAAAAGLMLVAWDIPAHREQVEMFGGELVPAGDVSALAQRLDELSQLPAEDLHRRKVETQRRARERLDPVAAGAAWWRWFLS